MWWNKIEAACTVQKIRYNDTIWYKPIKRISKNKKHIFKTKPATSKTVIKSIQNKQSKYKCKQWNENQ